MGQHAFSIPRLIENKGLLSIWFRFQASLEIKYYFPLKTHFKYIYTDFDALHFLKKTQTNQTFGLFKGKEKSNLLFLSVTGWVHHGKEN